MAATTLGIRSASTQLHRNSSFSDGGGGGSARLPQPCVRFRRRLAGFRPLAAELHHHDRPEGQGEESVEGDQEIVRTLLIDNYDSYTYNIFQQLSVVNRVPPVVVYNDEWTWDYINYCLYEKGYFDNIVISPGPGSPAHPNDIGVCLQILQECGDIPILGVCLGHQALGYVHGANIVHAPEPIHGRLSEIEHSGCSLFDQIPSGRNSGFKVVRYHSLVVEPESLPKELIPTAWTASSHTLSFLERENTGLINGILYDKREKLLSTINGKDSTEVLMGIMHCTRPHYGVQFHPESVATYYGNQIFKNFKKLTIQHGLQRQDRKVHN